MKFRNTTLSIWRYSHLTLAISSFLFVIIAAVTGIILAFEPISNQLKPYADSDLSSVSVATMLQNLQNEYEEVLTVEVEANHFVTASVITKEGENATFYIDPNTGKKVGDLIEKATIFKFSTSLHRSLFLKTTGRFFVGLVSFLLFLIAISGTILIVKRQGSVQQFFAKITNENWYQYFHVVFGRFSLIPIIIITLTGVYLSLEKFNVFPKEKMQHAINFDALKETPQKRLADFPVFKNTTIAEVRTIEFPFSPDVEDYFLIQLKDKGITVNQITGEVLSEVAYPFSKIASHYSLILHTGQGSIIWSVVLLLASIAILFFIYSGFVMTFQRIRGNTKNKFKKEDCEYIILVGSENGSTKSFAKMLYKAFLKEKKKVFVTDLNAYDSFEKMQHLIVLTATYGEGDAPSNATKFLKLIQNEKLNSNAFSYSVVAFGSLSYPKFCQFGIEVQEALAKKTSARELVPFQTINNRSVQDFSKWTAKLSEKLEIPLELDTSLVTKREKTTAFTLVDKKINQENNDATFLLTFESKKQGVTSGDLLAIYPNEATHERLYSIAKIGKQILLSIKKHELGVCSNYLYNLQVGDSIQGFIKKNPGFHFPKNAAKVIMMANGTGIAPFLGMMQQQNTIPIDLYFGVKNQQSLKLYDAILNEEHLLNIHYAFSQEQQSKIYVQDLVEKHAPYIIADLEQGAVIMICGALAMQKAVFEALDQALESKNKSIQFYQEHHQILTDCY